MKASPQRSRRTAAKSDAASPTSATDRVLDLIKRSRNGVTITQIREQTGYDDKKLRNIIYRLNQRGKITRISRGSYKVSG